MKFQNMFNVQTHTHEGKGDKLNVPIKLWLSEVESGALTQMEHLAMLPFAFHHVAGMPDMHQGYGMPIGGVMATKGYIVPNAVGMDIGCGMCSIKTSLFVGSLSKDILKKIMSDIRKLIPVGFKHHKNSQGILPDKKMNNIVDQQFASASRQLGTLGGGNHFIEIQKGDDGLIIIK